MIDKWSECLKIYSPSAFNQNVKIPKQSVYFYGENDPRYSKQALDLKKYEIDSYSFKKCGHNIHKQRSLDFTQKLSNLL